MGARWRSVFVCSVWLVVAAACGGGGGGGGGPKDATGPAPTGPAVDTATARTIVLQQPDMPAGWRAPAHTEDPGEQERSAKLQACLGRPDPRTTRSAIVYGPDLSMGQLQVSAISTVLNTAADANADLAAARGPKYADCVSAAFKVDLQRQAPTATIDGPVAEALPVEAFGDGSVGLRLTAGLAYPDHTDKLYADLVYITKGRANVSATFFSVGQPFPGTLEQSLVSRVGHRVAAA